MSPDDRVCMECHGWFEALVAGGGGVFVTRCGQTLKSQISGNNGSWTNTDDVNPLSPPLTTLEVDGHIYTLVPSPNTEEGDEEMVLAPVVAPTRPGRRIETVFRPLMTSRIAADEAVFDLLGEDMDHIPQWASELIVYLGCLYDTRCTYGNTIRCIWSTRGVEASGPRDGQGDVVYLEQIPPGDPDPSTPSWKYGRRSFEGGIPPAPTRTAAQGQRGGLDSQLNGANGEVTGKDDVKPKAGKKERKRASTAPAPAAPSARAIKAMVKRMAASAIEGSSRSAGALAANALGVPGLAPALSNITAKGGAYLARAVGLGAVTMGDVRHNFDRTKSNAILSGPDPQGMYRTNSHNTTTVATREKVWDIRSSSTSAGNIVILEIVLNPGLANFFRKSSLNAQLFSCYVYKGLVFEFVSECSEFITGGVTPLITMGVTMNVNQPTPTTLEGMEALDDTLTFKGTENAAFAVECRPGTGYRGCYLTRQGAVPSTASRMDYDYGKFVLALQVPAAISVDTLLGQLHVTSMVEFSKPCLSPARYGVARFTRTGAVAASPFGVTQTVAVRSGALFDVSFDSAGTVCSIPVAPNTVIQVDVFWGGGSVTPVLPATRTFNNFTLVNLLKAGSASQASVGAGVASGELMYTATLMSANAPDEVPNITFSTNGTLPSGAYCDIRISILGCNSTVGTDI